MNEKRNFFISHFTLPFYIRNTCNWLTHKILKSLKTTIIAVAVEKIEIRVGEKKILPTQQKQQQQEQQKLK